MGDKLKDNDPMKIYNNKWVCDYHFKSEEITAGRRVVYGAIPSLNLTDELMIYKIKIIQHHEISISLSTKEDYTLNTHFLFCLYIGSF